MDPVIANQDFDPPKPPSLLRRGLVPALLVNLLFVIALGWSVPWYRETQRQQAAAPPPADLATMGAPPQAAPDGVQAPPPAASAAQRTARAAPAKARAASARAKAKARTDETAR